ncbi:MAG: hypothetical protein HYU34_00345, partial [Candidatus Omnitrophica bacterium]|nr:hypothetical protein [Candidatus Omnitrophota bacterium]
VPGAGLVIGALEGVPLQTFTVLAFLFSVAEILVTAGGGVILVAAPAFNTLVIGAKVFIITLGWGQTFDRRFLDAERRGAAIAGGFAKFLAAGADTFAVGRAADFSLIALLLHALLAFPVPASVVDRAGVTVITDGGVCLPDALPLHTPVVRAGILIIALRVAFAGTGFADRLTPIPGRAEFLSVGADASFRSAAGQTGETEFVLFGMKTAVVRLLAGISSAVNGIGTIPVTAASALTLPALLFADRAKLAVIAGIRIKRVFTLPVIAPVVGARIPIAAVRLTCAFTGNVRFLATSYLFA